MAKVDGVAAEQRPWEASTVLLLSRRDCACGQQLDVCGRAHCPRCGRSLPRD